MQSQAAVGCARRSAPRAVNECGGHTFITMRPASMQLAGWLQPTFDLLGQRSTSARHLEDGRRAVKALLAAPHEVGVQRRCRGRLAHLRSAGAAGAGS